MKIMVLAVEGDPLSVRYSPFVVKLARTKRRLKKSRAEGTGVFFVGLCIPINNDSFHTSHCPVEGKLKCT
jgi:hypothetical protein